MIKLAGTWTFTQGSAAAVGVDTQALTSIFVGDAISIDRDKLYRVLTIISDTSITFEPAFVEATAAGAQGWLLPVSTTRPSFGALSAQFTDLRSRYSEIMVVSGADRRITLNKAAVGDFSEIIHQAAGVNKFKTGLIADNEWALMAFINGAWANVLKTVSAGVSPSQTVSLAYALAIGVGLGTAALPGMAFVGRADTGLWSPAAATLAASAGGVEVWRSTASLITLAQNLKLSKASPIFDINAAAAGQARLFRSYTNDVLRWQMDFGDATSEAGGNAGSDYYLRAYNDAGASIGSAITIARASMLATFAGAVSVASITPSSTTLTGAIKTAGGLGVALSANIGTSVTVTAAPSGSPSLSTAFGAFRGIFTSTTQVDIGALTASPFSVYIQAFAGGSALPLQLNPLGGVVSILGTTASISTTTGALTIAGGLGIVGSLHVGNGGFGMFSQSGSAVRITNELLSAQATSNDVFPVFLKGANLGFGALITNTSGSPIFFYQGTGANTVGSVSVSTTSTTYNTSSDRSRKFDERPFTRAGRVIDNTEIWDFAWKNGSGRGVGVFAQDAYKVFPDAIMPSDRSGGWQADYSKYVPVLIADAQETHRRLTALEAHLAV